MERNTVYGNLDDRIKSILNHTRGWLVGNSISDILTGKEPNDFDIIVPDTSRYNAIVRSLTTDYSFTINNYGGIKIDTGDFTLDIWTEELDHFLLTANRFTYAFNFYRRILLKSL